MTQCETMQRHTVTQITAGCLGSPAWELSLGIKGAKIIEIYFFFIFVWEAMLNFANYQDLTFIKKKFKKN